jgi:PhoPQ-activated pathogenicity-related protein
MRFAALVLTIAATLQPASAQSTSNSAIERYVQTPDPVYAWKLARTIEGEGGVKTHVLELTSQTWRTEKDVDKPVWKHWLTIVQPPKIEHKTALLFIGGGSSKNPVPAKAPDRAIQIARDTNTVVADLGQVPNQPLRFTDTPNRERVEDDIIAYTRVKHFSTKDDTWLVRLAMVKSGVRALDAIQEFLKQTQKVEIDKFVVAGGSKRGWTTWLVGLVDKRVTAIMPMVIDALNSEVITRHHYEAYGFFSSALSDYVEHGLFPGKIGTPEYQAVLKIEDPYQYRDRLTLPKFMINASGDQFFLPDNSQFYFNDLKGEKYIRYVPNTKHNLAESDAVESLTAYYQAILTNTPRPQFKWEKRKDGSLRLEVKDKPQQVTLWQATNPKARDFRLDVIGKAYTATPAKEIATGVYEATISKPASGYTAFYLELVYPSGGKYPLKFSTEVSVVPDILPFEWKNASKKH